MTGQFTIDEVTFLSGPTGPEIETFAASFEQHSEGATPALFGTFTFDAQVPEPGTIALLVVGLLPLFGLVRRGRRAHR